MNEEKSSLVLKPIGTVRNEIKEPRSGGDWWSDLVSEVLVDPELNDALTGLEDFSHIIVLFWIDRPPGREMQLKIKPMGRDDIPLTGLFATRTPARPNRIGLTVVKLLERKDNVLRVKGLDAIDGTPLLDIKPYIPIADLMKDAKTPEWIKQQ